MTEFRKRSGEIVVAIDDAVGETCLSLEYTLLPMMIWENVQLPVQVPQELTTLQRFVIECLLELDDCGPDDLQEIAGIPLLLGMRLLESLQQLRLAARLPKDRFGACPVVCEAALKSGAVAEVRPVPRTVLWFPEHEEFCVMPKGDAQDFVKQVSKLQPALRYPLSERYRREKRMAILSRAIENNQLYGLSATVGELCQDDTIIDDEFCAAYRCRVTGLNKPGDARKMTIFGSPADRDRSSTNPGDSVECRIPVPDLPYHVQFWKQQFASAEPSVSEYLIDQGFKNPRFESATIRVDMTEAVARRLSQNRLLTQSVSVEVRCKEWTFTVPMQLKPDSQDVQAMFAFDARIAELLASPQIDIRQFASENEQAAIRNEHDSSTEFSAEAVTHRLWTLKQYASVYAIREVGDFHR